MRCTLCGRPEHAQEVISAVAALRSYRLEIEIGIQIRVHPLDDAPQLMSRHCALVYMWKLPVLSQREQT